jgi:hypothetical protein
MPRRPIEPMTLGNMRELGAGCLSEAASADFL